MVWNRTSVWEDSPSREDVMLIVQETWPSLLLWNNCIKLATIILTFTLEYLRIFVQVINCSLMDQLLLLLSLLYFTILLCIYMITVAENDYMYLFHSTLFKIMTNLWNLNYVKSLTWLLLKLFYICCSSIIQDKAFHNHRTPPLTTILL